MLNRHLAMALEDGLSVGALAEAAQLSRKDVRQTRLVFDDAHPPGTPKQEHLAAVAILGVELAALKQSKSSVEADQLLLLAKTRNQHLLDDFELALLTGLRHENIRKMTWGMGTSGSEAHRTRGRR